MARWQHISCGYVADGYRVPPASCEFCVSLSAPPPEEGWRLAEPTKRQRREISKKAKNRRGKIGKKQRERIYERDGYECVRCGQDDPEELTLDHIIPVSRGGTSKDDNLQTMCKWCNGLKGNKTGSNGMRWPSQREMRRRGLLP
jgi:5-methylcytosine-specific restriction endonuclease McrA